MAFKSIFAKIANGANFQQAVQRLARLAADDRALAAPRQRRARFPMLDQLREIKPNPSALPR